MGGKEKKDFDKEAPAWDANPVVVKLAREVAAAVIAEARPTKETDALDFGCGTGQLTLRLQPMVRAITGADGSKGMLAVLDAKVKEQGLGNVRSRLVDLERDGTIQGVFDLIVSSMTLHHVQDPAALLKRLFGHLRPGGTICVADLDKEDGSFHPDTTGVFHFGFDRAPLRELFAEAGFSDVRDGTATRIVRSGENGTREYPVFLITATRR